MAADDIAPEGRIEYDKRGNMIKLVCYDGYGKKTTGLHGWSEHRFTYDEAGLKHRMHTTLYREVLSWIRR